MIYIVDEVRGNDGFHVTAYEDEKKYQGVIDGTAVYVMHAKYHDWNRWSTEVHIGIFIKEGYLKEVKND